LISIDVNSFVLNEEMITVSAVNMYKEWFEEPFLKIAKRFYQMVANNDLNEYQTEYLTKASVD
jgi:hypothetical protein